MKTKKLIYQIFFLTLVVIGGTCTISALIFIDNYVVTETLQTIREATHEAKQLIKPRIIIGLVSLVSAFVLTMFPIVSISRTKK